MAERHKKEKESLTNAYMRNHQDFSEKKAKEEEERAKAEEIEQLKRHDAQLDSEIFRSPDWSPRQDL